MTEPTGTGEPIGTGSLFDVTLLREDGRAVVQKRLLPRFQREPEARAALVREARVLTAARHPSLPELVRVGSDDKGPYLVETFVAGASIRRIADVWSSRGGVPARLAAHLARQAFAMLAELSELQGEGGPLGFVHGDIGPDHLLLGPVGEARLIDFGAARIHGLERSLLGNDRGTLPFVAPEVARGEAPPSAATDVYALAATVLFLSSGKALTRATDEAAMLVEVGTHGVRAAELLDETQTFRPQEKAALLGALALSESRRVVRAADVLAAFDGA